MSTVRIDGWHYGLQKVSMTKCIRHHSRMSLANAKECTDAVLDGQTMIVVLPNLSEAISLAEELNKLGAIAEVVE